jgi:hypothetical protein
MIAPERAEASQKMKRPIYVVSGGHGIVVVAVVAIVVVVGGYVGCREGHVIGGGSDGH